ncbi:hypothetical protein RCL1_002695 [Eukaryota sp. TZLM3-RCL]
MSSLTFISIVPTDSSVPSVPKSSLVFFVHRLLNLYNILHYRFVSSLFSCPYQSIGTSPQEILSRIQSGLNCRITEPNLCSRFLLNLVSVSTVSTRSSDDSKSSNFNNSILVVLIHNQFLLKSSEIEEMYSSLSNISLPIIYFLFDLNFNLQCFKQFKQRFSNLPSVFCVFSSMLDHVPFDSLPYAEPNNLQFNNFVPSSNLFKDLFEYDYNPKCEVDSSVIDGFKNFLTEFYSSSINIISDDLPFIGSPLRKSQHFSPIKIIDFDLSSEITKLCNYSFEIFETSLLDNIVSNLIYCGSGIINNSIVEIDNILNQLKNERRTFINLRKTKCFTLLKVCLLARLFELNFSDSSIFLSQHSKFLKGCKSIIATETIWMLENLSKNSVCDPEKLKLLAQKADIWTRKWLTSDESTSFPLSPIKSRKTKK